MKLRTKMFEEQRVYRREAGAAPGVWRRLSSTPSVADSVNKWLTETGFNLVSAGTPGIDARWLDGEMKIRSVLIAVMIIYEEAEIERTIVVPGAQKDSDASQTQTAGPASGRDANGNTLATETESPIDGGLAPFPGDRPDG